MASELCILIISSLVFCSTTTVSGFKTEETTASEGSRCKTLFTFGYGYRQFFRMASSSLHQRNGDMVHMRFQVRARNDAHVLLSPNPSPEESDPVYEIVLGAGKNSFSDIRRKRRAATKASAYTKDILSGTEMKAFWIRITSEGLILVGHEGDDLPFMQWQDPEPFPVQYFSFCTWTGVAGKWLYDCDVPQMMEGLVAVEPTLTAIERLRKALLTDYDIFSRPISNHSEVFEIDIQFQVNYIKFDAKKSVMAAECALTMEWFDQKMIWNPDSFGDLTLLNLNHHEIWQPELVHFNAAGKDIAPWGQSKAGMRVAYDGKVRWSPRATLESKCRMNMRHWPWDRQTCSLQLGFWQLHNTTRLMLWENGTVPEQQHPGSEWLLEAMTAETVVVTTPWLLDSAVFPSDDSGDFDSELPSALTFTLTLRRVKGGYFYVLVIPLIVMVVMSLACFWMDPLGREKLATDCLLLVLLCGFLLSLDSTIPAPADHLPYLLRAYVGVLAVVACATVVTVFVTSLVRTSHLRPPPRFVTRALTSPFVTSIFCLSLPRAKKHDYGQLSETGERSDSISLAMESDDNVDQYWALVAAFCDRLAFLSAVAAYTAIFVY